MPSESVDAKSPREQAAEVLAVTLLEMLVQPSGDGSRCAGAGDPARHPGSGSGAAMPTSELGSGCDGATAGKPELGNKRTSAR